MTELTQGRRAPGQAEGGSVIIRYALVLGIIVLMAAIHGFLRVVAGVGFDSSVANVVVFWFWPYAAGSLATWAFMSEDR